MDLTRIEDEFKEKKTPDPKSTLVGEIVVNNKKVTDIKEKGKAGQTTIPNNGFVLAAHGTAWKWFIDHNVQVGTQITITNHRVSIQNTPGGSSSRTDLTDIQSQLQSLTDEIRKLDAVNYDLGERVSALDGKITNIEDSIKSFKPGGISKTISNWKWWLLGILAVLALAIFFALRRFKHYQQEINKHIDDKFKNIVPEEKLVQLRDELQRQLLNEIQSKPSMVDVQQEINKHRNGISIANNIVQDLANSFIDVNKSIVSNIQSGGQPIDDAKIHQMVKKELEDPTFMELSPIAEAFNQRDEEIKKLSKEVFDEHKKVFDEHKKEIKTLSSNIGSAQDEIIKLLDLRKDFDEHKKEIQDQIQKELSNQKDQYEEKLAECVDELFRGDEEAEKYDDQGHKQEPDRSGEPGEEKNSTGERQDEEKEKDIIDDRKKQQLEAIKAFRSKVFQLVIDQNIWKPIESRLEEIERLVSSGEHGVIQSTLLPQTINFLCHVLEVETVKQTVESLDFSTLFGIQLTSRKRGDSSGSAKIITFKDLEQDITSQVPNREQSRALLEAVKTKAEEVQKKYGTVQNGTVLWVVKPSMVTTAEKKSLQEEEVITPMSDQYRMTKRSRG